MKYWLLFYSMDCAPSWCCYSFDARGLDTGVRDADSMSARGTCIVREV
jgi:hypothetical protein